MIKIPQANLPLQFKALEKEIFKKWQKILASGHYLRGSEVDVFEKSFAKFCQVKYAHLVASGTDALLLALEIAGVTKGDEVITPSFTFVSSAISIARLGAKPIFVDIDPFTFNIDVQQIEKAITKKTKVILPVHLYGNPCKIEIILKIAKKHKLKVIEDASQAPGALFSQKPVGSFGDLATFSFYPTKNLGSFSDSGAITTNNSVYKKRLSILANYGFKTKYISSILGYNSRIDSLQAAWLSTHLKHIKKWNRKRRYLAKRYLKFLKHLPLVLPKETPDSYHVYHAFTIRTPYRESLKKYLAASRISTAVYYPMPIHRQPAFKDQHNLKLPESEKASREVLSLPIYPQMKLKEQDYVIQAINKFFERKK